MGGREKYQVHIAGDFHGISTIIIFKVQFESQNLIPTKMSTVCTTSKSTLVRFGLHNKKTHENSSPIDIS